MSATITIELANGREVSVSADKAVFYLDSSGRVVFSDAIKGTFEFIDADWETVKKIHAQAAVSEWPAPFCIPRNSEVVAKKAALEEEEAKAALEEEEEAKATRKPVYDDRPMPSSNERSGSSSGSRETEYGGNSFGWGHEYG